MSSDVQRVVELFSSHTLEECEEIFRSIRVYKTKKAIKNFLDVCSEGERAELIVSMGNVLIKKCDHKSHLVVNENDYVVCTKCGWVS